MLLYSCAPTLDQLSFLISIRDSKDDQRIVIVFHHFHMDPLCNEQR